MEVVNLSTIIQGLLSIGLTGLCWFLKRQSDRLDKQDTKFDGLSTKYVPRAELEEKDKRLQEVANHTSECIAEMKVDYKDSQKKLDVTLSRIFQEIKELRVEVLNHN